MHKLVLLSAVLSIIVLPVIASRAKNPKAGLKKALIYMVVFNVCYLLALRFLIHGV
jgi:hypothetical protein